MEINMWTFIFVSIILLIILLLIALVLALKGILDSAIWLLVIDIFLLIVGLVVFSKDTKKPTIKYLEYPASSYTLEYKVTELQGKIDTIYVLTPKEYNKYKNGN